MTDDRRSGLAARSAEVSCASLVDAMGRLHDHRAHLLPLASPDPTRPLFGRAATITFLPARSDVEEPPDFAELARFDFATWCRGEATRWGGDVVMPYAAGEPVAFDGVCVFPGDLLYLDASGGVVIPARSASEVFAEAERIEAEDAESTERIRAERPDAPSRGAR